MSEKPKMRNQSVARAMRILELLAASSGGAGVREIGRSIGASPSIAQRLISTLAEFGFAEQDALRKYRIGVRAFKVGNAFISANALAKGALTELQRMAEEHQFNSYLGILRGQSVVYLLTCQSTGPIAIKSSPGAEAYLHTTSLGKAILAQMPDAEVKRLLGLEPYPRLTPNTKTRLGPLLSDLHVARRTGYAICDEENLLGVYAIGAAVRDATGATVAAISGALPRHEVTQAKLPGLCRLVRETADRISSRLGATLETI